MGVHDTEKYSAIKHLLGIPEDEPIFIVRAQDDASTALLSAYANITYEQLGVPREFVRNIADLNMEFASWRTSNRDKCKTPD